MMEGLRRLFEGATPRDALIAVADILIVYYVIYRRAPSSWR